MTTTDKSKIRDTSPPSGWDLVTGPLYDHCPNWCADFASSRDANSDDHGDVHETATLRPLGSRVFAHLERPDLHGLPSKGVGPLIMQQPEVCLSAAGVVDDVRMSVPEARSLARILIHLADLAEL